MTITQCQRSDNAVHGAAVKTLPSKRRASPLLMEYCNRSTRRLDASCTGLPSIIVHAVIELNLSWLMAVVHVQGRGWKVSSQPRNPSDFMRGVQERGSASGRLWAHDVPLLQRGRMSTPRAVNLSMQEVGAESLTRSPVIIGGESQTVEMDESLFSKWKSNHG
ncbi:hypothetical protein M513_12637 [Trichuris suis]|uniref:Uncharacterized protein n=1 Tax=Trichuris suis TaxID=68888 RepID=A0A085LNE9_9BILA|nr:hypothetical protein M513_12637 [Trichuris suis]